MLFGEIVKRLVSITDCTSSVTVCLEEDLSNSLHYTAMRVYISYAVPLHFLEVYFDKCPAESYSIDDYRMKMHYRRVLIIVVK